MTRFLSKGEAHENISTGSRLRISPILTQSVRNICGHSRDRNSFDLKTHGTLCTYHKLVGKWKLWFIRWVNHRWGGVYLQGCSLCLQGTDLSL